ncbi:MAG: hypothetical protein AB1665_04575 [Candidatus Thermoplasmatota archaeon]
MWDRQDEAATINLYAGWNMGGYPVRNDSSYTVGNLKAATGATHVEGSSAAATYKTSVLPESYVLQRGEGYWLCVPADTIWIVDW